MTRYKLTLEYHGRAFVGWQRQVNGLSVQQVIEEAISMLSGETAITHVAGRTDAGVHATGQVCHFDLEKDIDPATVRDALNFHAKPNPVSILEAEIVGKGFHARFSAVERIYLYKITNRRAPLTLQDGLSWWVPQELDTNEMGAAAEFLVGRHDFSTFRAAGCQADSAIKTLNQLTIDREGEIVLIYARAQSFLYHQVRNMVGTLKLAGEGKWTPDEVLEALMTRHRAKGGPTAPPQGLYLTQVVY